MYASEESPMLNLNVENNSLNFLFSRIFFLELNAISFCYYGVELLTEPTVWSLVTKNEIRPIIILLTGQTGFQLSGW